MITIESIFAALTSIPIWIPVAIIAVIIFICVVAWNHDPFDLPLYQVSFDLTNKRSPDYMAYICDWAVEKTPNGIQKIYNHRIATWRAPYDDYMKSCFWFHGRRLRQYSRYYERATASSYEMFEFVFYREHTRYRQQNYRRYAYTVQDVERRIPMALSSLLDLADARGFYPHDVELAVNRDVRDFEREPTDREFPCNHYVAVRGVRAELLQGITPAEFERKRHNLRGDITGVYVLYNVDRDMPYVGQAKNIYDRVNRHLSGHGCSDAYADYRHGDTFRISIFPLVDSGYQNLDRFEKDYIAKYDALQHGYNKTAGNG